MSPFKAYRVFKEAQGVVGRLVTLDLSDLSPGNVVIEAHYSSINYKDSLGATGKGAILKKFPLVAGIDVAGVVKSSTDREFPVGAEVLVTGCGLGETIDGGLSEIVRVPAEYVVRKPEGMSLKESMILGTAGFTAALCLHRMLQNNQSRDKGPIVVTGASGGVGSISVALFAQAGFEVIAVSGKEEAFPLLKDLGAKDVLSLSDLALSTKPLSKARFGGAVDNLGGAPLAGLLASTALWGNVASVGLALSSELHSSVFPHILRGVSLLGISSANAPMGLRQQIWQRLADDWKIEQINAILSEVVALTQVESVFERMLSRRTKGRILVDCRG